MEELSAERRAAFRAVGTVGLDKYIPLLFEIEPTHDELRPQLDMLVDRADYFLGIYYSSYGRSYEELHGLCPIVYECMRFVIRHSLIPGRLWISRHST